MTTLHEQWIKYRDTLYPNGIPALQEKETHQAFVAGALCVKLTITELAQMPSAQAQAALQKFYREIDEHIRCIVQLTKSRN